MLTSKLHTLNISLHDNLQKHAARLVLQDLTLSPPTLLHFKSAVDTLRTPLKLLFPNRMKYLHCCHFLKYMHAFFGTPHTVMSLPHFHLDHENLHMITVHTFSGNISTTNQLGKCLTHSSSSLCSRVLVGQLLITVMLS